MILNTEWLLNSCEAEISKTKTCYFQEDATDVSHLLICTSYSKQDVKLTCAECNQYVIVAQHFSSKKTPKARHFLLNK